MKIKELLTDESKWTQDVMARDIGGLATFSLASDAVEWCLLGALNKCYYSLKIEDYNIIREKIEKEVGQEISQFNDNATFEQVKSLVEKLDI